MKLSVHLVTWNGAKYVPLLFQSLRNQTYKDWQLVILDNASTDGMVEAMKQELENFPVECELIESTENTGFAGGHNQLYKKLGIKSQELWEYFVCLNQDLYLEPDCLEKLVQFLDTHQDTAVISPRLMKWEFMVQLPLLQGESLAFAASKRLRPRRWGEAPEKLTNYTDQIDSLGLKIYRNRRVREKYSGKLWSEVKGKMHLSFRAERFRENQTALEVFGVSGTLPCFRRSMIEAVCFPNGTFFDESYHSYKEDVDLAWRLRSGGYKAYVLLETVAYHDRSAAGPATTDDRAARENKKTQSEWVKYHSYQNHLMTLYKNEYGQNFLIDFPFIVWYELKKFGYFLVFDRAVLKGLAKVWRLRHELKEKKGKIKEKRKVSWKELRTWWK